MLQSTDRIREILLKTILVLACIVLVILCSVNLHQKGQPKELSDSRSTGQIILDLISKGERD